MSSAADTRALLQQRYAALAPRERLLVSVMAGAIAFLIVWLIGVRPAWRVLEQAPALRSQADVQLLQMRALASEAAQLRALPPVAQTDAVQALQAATDQLAGRAKLTILADRATLTLSGATGEDLRQWLLQARSGARARPVEASLTRGANGYNGTLVVAIGTSQ